MRIILEAGDPKPEILNKHLAPLKYSGVKITYVCEPDNKTPKVIIFEDIKINTEKQWVKVLDKKIKLTKKEYELLLIMSLRPEFPIRKEKMLEQIWGTAKIKTRTVDTHILTLRSKLGVAHKYIKTIAKVGYMISAEN